ncbi:DrmE family protein [Myxococcota bacterium]|nr:DrmE family protein [Myxococcota bacterium]
MEPLVDDIVDRVRRAQVLRRLGVDSAEDATPARLVYFAGGAWVPFGPNHSVNTVTHLVESGGSSDSDTLREVPSSELRSGDVVVMVRGSNHDALRHAADLVLPAGARETATLWRDALQRFLGAGHTPRDLRSRLEREGCRRTPQTIRNWINNDRIIGPKDALDGTIEAIQRATGDEELGQRLQGCSEAIHLVRSTHFTVAHKLAIRVLDSAREWLDADTRPDELVEVEERLVLLTVDSVDSELADVPRSALNRLREEET